MGMKFNDEQKLAIESNKSLVLISAGAGSGKTRVLTERFIYLCEQRFQEILTGKVNPIGATVKEIVAITFTEKAAREMKKRIRDRISSIIEEVNQWEKGPDRAKGQVFWKEQRESLDSGFITTFHSFCHKLLHQYAFTANLSPSFTVLDDTQSKLLKNQCFNDIFRNDTNHSNWKNLYGYYTREQLKTSVLGVYDQLQENPRYRDINEFINGLDIKEILSIQKVLMEEIKKKMLLEFYHNAKVCVSAFPHESSVTAAVKKHLQNISNHMDKVNLEELSVEETYPLLLATMPKKVMAAWGDTAPSLLELCNDHFKPLKERWKQYQSLTPEREEDFCKVIGLFTDVVTSFHKIYTQKKDERAALDFGDLQKAAIGLLRDEEDIRLLCQKEYKHFMVDEFQDTNGLQMGMLEYIQPHYRFIVGDGKQSIYRFRGADVTLMNSLEDEVTGVEDCDFIDMGKNYRNCDSIIQFVNELFKGLMEKNKATLGYGIDYKPLVSNRVEPLEAYPNKRVELILLESPKEGEDIELQFSSEYDLLTERMLEMVTEGKEIVKGKTIVAGNEVEKWRKPQWRDFAILLTSRTGLTQLERCLNDKNIPYIVHGGIGFFQKQEIKDMLNLLRLINRPWEMVYMLAVLRSPLFKMNFEEFFHVKSRITEDSSLPNYIYSQEFEIDEQLPQGMKEKLRGFYKLFVRFVPMMAQKSFKEVLYEVFEESGLKTALLIQRNPLQLVKNVEKLIDMMANQNAHSLEELLEQVDILASISDKEGEAEAELPEGNMVNIMTVHASKGLEFPMVCLPKLSRNLQKDSWNFYYDEEVFLVAKFKEDKKDDPFNQEEVTTPSYGLVKGKSDVAALEESKRLFYVAATRARDYLLMTAKEKVAKDSWLEMLLSRLDANETLKGFIDIKKHDAIVSQNYNHLEEEVFHANLEHKECHIPFTFSVSEVMQFMNEPMEYYNNYILKINQDWFPKDTEQYNYDDTIVAGSEFGTIVHRACELYDQGFGEEESVLEALQTFEEDIVNTEKFKKEALALLEYYKELKALDIGEHVASEWSFTTELAGAYIIGEIDKVLKKDDVYHLMDLKTNLLRNEDKLMESYMPQIYLYKMAYEREMGVQVNEVSLFFMRGGKDGLKTFKADATYEEKVKNAIVEMSRLKRMKAGRAEYWKGN